jgi:hypothetical protein
MRRKKVTYPPPKTATKGGAAAPVDGRAQINRATSIDLSAMTGAGNHKIGDKVRILNGLYAGEAATVESVVGGVVPSVLVRTEAGRTRRTRTIDLAVWRPDAPQNTDVLGAAAESASPESES